MKVVLISLEDAKKTELKGAEKLAKNDILIIFSTKNKSDYPANITQALKEIKASTESVKLGSASELPSAYAYYAGLHIGKNHQVYIITENKTKVSPVIKQAKCYSSFASAVKDDSSSSTTAKSKSKKEASTENTVESVLTNTISSLTGLSKTQTKKIIKEYIGDKDSK